MTKHHHKHRNSSTWKHTILAAKIAGAGFCLGTVNNWQNKNTADGTLVNGKVENVSQLPANDSVRNEVITMLKERFNDVIIGYQNRDKRVKLKPEEIDYLAGRQDDIEVLAEARGITGFYGVLLLDHKTNQTILSYPGANLPTAWNNMRGLTRFWFDLDDMCDLSAGGTTSQTRPAIEFAKKAEQISIEKTGHGISYGTGHSLGQDNMAFVAGTNACPTAKFFFFDGPGIMKTKVKACAEISGMSEDEVKAIFRNRCYSLTFTHNLLNTMGTQSGIAVTGDNRMSTKPFFPEKHSYDGDFIAGMKNTTFIDRTNDEQSSASLIVVMALLMASIAPFLPAALSAPKRNTRVRDQRLSGEEENPKLKKQWRTNFDHHHVRNADINSKAVTR